MESSVWWYQAGERGVPARTKIEDFNYGGVQGPEWIMPGSLLPGPTTYPFSTSSRSVSNSYYHIDISDLNGVAGRLLVNFPMREQRMCNVA